MNGETRTTDVWKSAALVLAGIVISLIAWIWNQGRDQVTKQDLAPITAAVNSTQQQLGDVRSELSELKGELKAKKEISR